MRIQFAVPFFALWGFSPVSFAVDFKNDVEPILRGKCFKCHSGPRAKGKLRYDDEKYFAERIGEVEEPVIVPGKPLDSLLVKKASLSRSDSEAMPPPRRGEPLSVSELSIIKQWILEGASLEAGEPVTPPAPATTDTDKPDPAKVHIWTSTAGTTIEATFVKLDGKSVVLKKADGTEITVGMSQLAAESRKLATDLNSVASSQ